MANSKRSPCDAGGTPRVRSSASPCPTAVSEHGTCDRQTKDRAGYLRVKDRQTGGPPPRRGPGRLSRVGVSMRRQGIGRMVMRGEKLEEGPGRPSSTKHNVSHHCGRQAAAGMHRRSSSADRCGGGADGTRSMVPCLWCAGAGEPRVTSAQQSGTACGAAPGAGVDVGRAGALQCVRRYAHPFAAGARATQALSHRHPGAGVRCRRGGRDEIRGFASGRRTEP